MDKLWGVYCEDLGENWPRYNGTALYIVKPISKYVFNFPGLATDVCQYICPMIYRKVSNIRRTKSENLNASRPIL